MQFMNADADPSAPRIRKLTLAVDDGRCTLRWLWPEQLEAVYVERVELNQVNDDRESKDHSSESSYRGHQSLSSHAQGKLKLYTREEYKANGGYSTRLEGIGRYLYTVYAVLEEDGEPLLVRQPARDNEIAVSTGRAKIRYAVQYKNSWFKPVKAVTIRIAAEVPVPKEALCYVKKQGSAPASRDDGMMYPFVSDFAAGATVLPPIEVGKQEYVRLFLSDGKQYGQLYELIPM